MLQEANIPVNGPLILNNATITKSEVVVALLEVAGTFGNISAGFPGILDTL